MILHHFTSSLHWPQIEQVGGLQPSESNVGSPVPGQNPHGEHVGPDVVWLLDTPELDYDHGLVSPYIDKTTTRITVDVRAIRWLDWAPAHHMNPVWRERFLEAAGGEAAAAHWYVWPAVIRMRRFVEVVDVPSDTILWRP